MLNKYSFAGIEKVKNQYGIDINQMENRYSFEMYCLRNFRRLCGNFRIRQDSYVYTECFDACQLAYLYSLCRCSISDKRDSEAYVMAYIRKVMKHYFIAAMTLADDSRNLCKENNFKMISADDYRI